MTGLALHALLGLSVAALAGAGLRAASLAAPGGLERVIAASVLACATAVVWALVLGLVRLGGSPVALSLGAAVTWLAARLLLPAPARPLGAELRAGWERLGTGERAALGAVAGLWIAYTAWLLRYPSLGLDATAYHLTEAVRWVHLGTPGSVELILYEFPVGNYPVTNEVLLAWGLGISRGLAVAAVWSPASAALAAAAAWLGLRDLRVPRTAAALAIAVTLSVPVGVDQLRGPGSDVPALAWLLCTASLALASRRRPALLAPALVAAGLAVGTKTTALPFVIVALGVALYVARGSLRPLRWPLAAGALGALAVGSVWYVRNLVDHGSPFWPFAPAPWGDPTPAYLSHFKVSLLEAPRASLSGRVGEYLEVLAGAPLLLAAAVLSPLFARRRAVLLAALASAAGALLWASVDTTGNSGFNPALDVSLSATRYLLPTIATAALALALVAREGGRAGLAAGLVLAVAAGWNLVRDAQLGFPVIPSPATLVLGAGGGVLVVLAAGWAVRNIGARPRLPRHAGALAGIGLALAGGLVLAVASRGFVERHGRTPGYDQALVNRLAPQPGFRDGGRLLSFAPAAAGVLTGDRLQNRLELIPPGASCANVRRRLRDGWVVVRSDPLKRLLVPFSADDCLRRRRPAFYDGAAIRVYTDRRGH